MILNLNCKKFRSQVDNFINCVFLDRIRSFKGMHKNSITLIVYILPLTPVTPEGGWDKCRIYFHTLETYDIILKRQFIVVYL